MKRILVIADIKGWAFDNIYNGLNKYCTNCSVDVFYLNEICENKIFDHYDVILYLCDNFTLPLIEWINRGLKKEKVILAVRSEVDSEIYDHSGLLEQVCEILAVSNEKLLTRFINSHSKVRLAPGGVDTEFYKFTPRTLKNDLIVGWAGSTSVFNDQFRGLDIIDRACKELNIKFVPALKEQRFRNKDEMLEYYNGIDIYVEMSKSAGRQNGLVEAGSCGVPVISYNCGIAERLINGTNGVLVDRREVELLKDAIINVKNNYEKFSINIRDSIEHHWSWKEHAKIFQDMFNEIGSNL